MSARALRPKLINYTALPYKSPLQPYVSWATMFVVSLVILFSGTLSLESGVCRLAPSLTNTPRLRCVRKGQFYGRWVFDLLS